VGAHIAQRLARDAVDEGVARPAGGGAVVDVQLGGQAGGLERAEQVAERDLQAGALQPGRVDLDEQRAQVALALAEVVDRAAQDGRGVVVAAARGAVRQRPQSEGHAGELLHGAVVEVGRDAPALLAGRLDRVGQQPLALAMAALQTARHRPGERQLEDEQDDQSAEQWRRESAHQPLGARADGAEALVDLEQDLGPVRSADRGVRLEQLSLLALVAVLGLGQVAELRLRPAGAEQPQLVGPETEAPADERGLVGVQDRPVPRPDLHADDRGAEDLAEHDVVEPGERAPIAAQHAVGQRGGLDEAPLHLHLIAGVALGLLDGDRAQREEPAHDHDRDRHERAQHEAADRRDDAR